MFKKEIAKLLAKHIKLKQTDVEKLIETPPSSEIGDYAFPCFCLAKKFKKNPVNICEDLANKIKPKSPVEEIKATGPYLNFFVDKAVFAKQILGKVNKDYGKKKLKGKGMIEFSQANTHKAFHVGHIRGTALGESLARIGEFFGHKVIRANYQGDTGMHIAKWVWCYKKYHKKEKIKQDEQWIANIYIDAIKKLAANKKLQQEVDEINRKLDKGKDKKLMVLWKKTRKLSLNAFENIYKELNTKFDKYYFESQVEQEGKKIAKELVQKRIAKISEGATIIDLEKYKLGVWVLLRTDGTALYSAKDLALAQKKFKDFNLDWSIYVYGGQELHFKQLKKTLDLMKFKDRKKVCYIWYDMVRLPTGKMSSRTGDNILYSSFKQELTNYAKKGVKTKWPKIKGKELEDRALKIAIAAMKYAMLSQDPNKVIIFDKKQAMKFEGETGPYLQYTYARASSIIRKSKKKPNLKIDKLTNKELTVVKKIAEFPEVVERAYDKFCPAIIAHYAYHLCQIFNEFYHNTKVIGTDQEAFKLKIVDSFKHVLKTSLYLLGIDVMEKM